MGADDELNLVVSKDDADAWHCVEVSLPPPTLGYGTYEFAVRGAVDDLADGDPSLVLGMFLYKDDAHELDVEFARWGATGGKANNADYVNQPNTGSNKALFWAQPPGLNATTHQIVYGADKVTWHSFVTGPGGRSQPYQTFESTDTVPAAAGMLVHINLWLFRGTPLRGARTEVNVSLSSFSFKPA